MLLFKILILLIAGIGKIVFNPISWIVFAILFVLYLFTPSKEQEEREKRIEEQKEAYIRAMKELENENK